MSEEIKRGYEAIMEEICESIDYSSAHKYQRNRYIRWKLLLMDLFADWQKRGERIKELEADKAKLEEILVKIKDEYKHMGDAYNLLRQQNFRLTEKKHQLQAQLAEREKEIEKLKRELERFRPALLRDDKWLYTKIDK